VSYFRPRQTGKIGPRTIHSFSDSTSRLSQNAGRVTLQSVPIPTVSFQGCSPKNWEQIENKSGTNYRRTPVNQVYQHVRKSLRSKDGLVFYPAHNPKVVSSNLTPATMGA
jgi:hypothetical protein